MYKKDKNILYLTSTTIMFSLLLISNKEKLKKIIKKRKSIHTDNNLLKNLQLLENGDMLYDVDNINFKIKKDEDIFLDNIDLEDLTVPNESLNIHSLINSKDIPEKKSLKTGFKNIQEQYISNDNKNHITEHCYETIWWGKLLEVVVRR